MTARGFLGIGVHEQHMKNGTQNDNLIYQSIYQTNTLKTTRGTNLTLKQMEIMIRNNSKGKLNKNKFFD